MVIIETAVIGAAGYGVYRGGEESAKKAKQAKKDFKFGQKLRGHRNELSSKSKARSERLAEINMMRTARNNDSTTASAGSGLGSTDSSRNHNAWPVSNSSSRSNNTTSSLDTTGVEDRQKAVMEKLSKSKPKPKSSMFGMFKKK